MFSTLSAPHKKSARRGFTLTELAIVLGVVGTILSAIWIAAGHTNNNMKAAKAAQETLMILNGYRQLYAAHGIDDPTEWDDVTCTGVAANIFPSDMLPGVTCSEANSAGTFPINAWGTGQMGVQVNQSTNMVLVWINNLSQQACFDYAAAVYNSGDMVYQWINNSGQYLPPIAPAAVPWTLASINAGSAWSCVAGNTNTIEIGVLAR